MLNETDLSRADLSLLALFEVVYEERHVGRAAERLNLTPSAISHALGRLRRLLNDPLFLRTPKGVAPTARASELAAPIADVMARVRGVIAAAAPFDPLQSRRRFTLGAPDAISAVILPPLLAAIGRAAPGIGLSVRQILPERGERSPDRAWRGVFAALDDRALDLAVIPHHAAPARFALRGLYDEDFVIAMRKGHPLAGDPTVERYCAEQHLVVSVSGDRYGFVDDILAERGLARDVRLTVPGFMLALAVLAETDLVAAIPRRFVRMHGEAMGVVGIEPPLALTRFRLHCVVPEVALADPGLAFLVDLLLRVAGR